MRIAIVSIHAQIRGGVEVYLGALVPQLRTRGHDVEVFSEERDGSAQGPPAPSCVERVLQFHPDVVLQNGLSKPGDELALIATGLPVVFFAHAYAGMCIGGTRRHAFPNLQVCQRDFGAPCLPLYFIRRCGGLNPVTAVALYWENQSRQKALRAAASVVVASEAMAAVVRRHGVPAERIATLPFFVEGPAELGPGTVERRRRGRRALFIGRMTDLKGWRQVVDACGLLRQTEEECTLVCAGDGPAQPDLRRRAASVKIKLELHPWLPPNERDALIDSGALLILPSTWPEPFGLVGLEAARLGVPAVAFDVGGIREWLVPGTTGLVASPSSPESLAGAMAEALRDELRYASMAEAARMQAARFGASRHVLGLEEVFVRATQRIFHAK